jgi:hypothetical protein
VKGGRGVVGDGRPAHESARAGRGGGPEATLCPVGGIFRAGHHPAAAVARARDLAAAVGQKSRVVCRVAAQRDIPALQWAVAAGADRHAVPTVCAMAAYGGQLAVLQQARQRGCPWDETKCSEAAGSGHLGVLQWARQHGCPWDADTCIEAACGGHLNVLRWARQHGGPWDSRTLTAVYEEGHIDMPGWAPRSQLAIVGPTGQPVEKAVIEL